MSSYDCTLYNVKILLQILEGVASIIQDNSVLSCPVFAPGKQGSRQNPAHHLARSPVCSRPWLWLYKALKFEKLVGKIFHISSIRASTPYATREGSIVVFLGKTRNAKRKRVR